MGGYMKKFLAACSIILSLGCVGKVLICEEHGDQNFDLIRYNPETGYFKVFYQQDTTTGYLKNDHMWTDGWMTVSILDSDSPKADYKVVYLNRPHEVFFESYINCE